MCRIFELGQPKKLQDQSATMCVGSYSEYVIMRDWKKVVIVKLKGTNLEVWS